MENFTFSFNGRLDSEFLYSIYEDDMDHVKSVFADFLKLVPPLMGEIEESFQSGEVELFRQRIHKLKPVFSFVGLTDITGKAEFLEKKCREIRALSEISHQYEELKNQSKEGIEIISEEIKRF